MSSNSRTQNFEKNVVFSIISQFTKIFLLFVNRIIFTRILGAEYLGINGLFSNVLSILSLADLGIATAMMYSLYRPLAEDDKNKITQYMNFFRKIYNLIAVVIAIIGIAIIPFLKYIVNLPQDMPHIYIYYILLLVNTVMSYLFVYQTTLITADQKQFVINKYDIIFQYILFILQIIVLVVSKNYILYLLVNIIITLLCNILKVKKTREYYPYITQNKHANLPAKEKKEVYENISSTFLYKIGHVIQENTDNILISMFVGTIIVGYYSNYLIIVSSIVGFLGLVFTSLKASLGNYVVEKDITEQLKMFNILDTINYWLVGFCTICFFNLIPDFIKIAFGEEYVLKLSVLILVIVNFYITNIKQTIWAYRETTGVFKKTKNITLVTSILNVVFSIVLGKLYGLNGIIGATILSKIIYSWWREPIILFGEYFKTSAKQYFVKYIIRMGIVCIVLFVTMYISNIVIFNNVYVEFIYKMLISVFIPSLCFIVIYRKSDAMELIKNKLIKGDIK